MLQLRRSLRHVNASTLLLLVFALVLLTWPYHHSPPSQSVVQSGSALFAHLKLTKTQQPTVAAINAVCRAHGFHAWTRPKRKVYDLVLFSTELDWLEIRLHSLAPFVDYFVIVESPTTFTGKMKPLTFKDNYERFSHFKDKIIYRTVEDEVESDRFWDHEAFFRNSLLRSVFPTLVGTPEEAAYGDVLIVSDMDELVRPETAMLLRFCDFPDRLTLHSDFYYYGFQWRHRGNPWPHPQVTTFKKNVDSTLAPEALRMGLLDEGFAPFAAYRRWRDRSSLFRAGWHCSFCFPTIEEVQVKMASFSHQGWNTPHNRDPATIIDHVRNGTDIFDRPGETYEKVEWMSDIPEYVTEQFYATMRLGYLLDRVSSIYGSFDDGAAMLKST